jgi:hypothetical protein
MRARYRNPLPPTKRLRVERFLRLALAFFLLATGLGLVLRYALVADVGVVTFGHALHAHSHTLYFGWAGLALFTLFFERVGATDAVARRTLGAVVVVSAATFVAFLHSGYARPGIIVSTLALGVWGFAVALFLRRAKGQRDADVTWLRVGAWYIVVASTAAGARVVVLVTKADPLWGKLAVAAFLTAFAGFFLFGVVGLLTRFLAERGAPLDARLLRWQLGWMTPLTALTFPLGVPGAVDTPLWPMARAAAVLLVVPAGLWLANLRMASQRIGPHLRRTLMGLAFAWAAKSIFEVGAALGFAPLAATSRQAVVMQLHLILLGVVSTSLLLLVRERLGRATGPGLVLHLAGVAVMCSGLLLAALAGFTALQLAPMGLWLAFAGGAAVVLVDVALVVDALRAPAAGAATSSRA